MFNISDYCLVMMAPSPSKSSKTQHPSFLITTDSVDTSPVPSSPPSTDAPKSQCSSLSDGESFECYGDNDISISETCGVDLELAPHLNSTTVGKNVAKQNLTIACRFFCSLSLLVSIVKAMGIRARLVIQESLDTHGAGLVYVARLK
uniref:Uncharacterized protein n=1 Tax=Anopheles christyi TaxID=43041 RepID=A0A182K2I7_9DIPT